MPIRRVHCCVGLVLRMDQRHDEMEIERSVNHSHPMHEPGERRPCQKQVGHRLEEQPREPKEQQVAATKDHEPGLDLRVVALPGLAGSTMSGSCSVPLREDKGWRDQSTGA